MSRNKINNCVAQMIADLTGNGIEAYYIGGIVRHKLYGLPTKDTDVVFDCSTQNLENSLNFYGIPYTRNVFGGINAGDYDLWTFEDHYYFKERNIPKKKRTIQNLLKTCILNFDAMAIRINDDKQFYHKSALKWMTKRVMDLTTTNKKILALNIDKKNTIRKVKKYEDVGHTMTKRLRKYTS